ncbi:MAG: metal ABC transporter permease [Candidatus Sumerlaeaceae bacterium]
MLDLLFNHTIRVVGLGAAVLGIVSGALGSYAVLRRQSLLGDAISHAALPGIAIAFLLTGSKAPMVLVLGAAIAGLAGTLLVTSVVNLTRVKDDAALGIVLSVFFGFGLVLLTYIQKLPNAAQAGLDKFLFGQAAALLESDVWMLMGIALAALVVVALLWKEFKLLTFDRDFGASLGFPIRSLEILLTGLLTVAIVLGLQTVGVVLMSAMVVAPAAAARQWTNRLSIMVLLSAAFGGASGVAGAIISSTVSHMPTGPTIVICITLIVVISLALAPRRGIVWSWLRARSNAHRLRLTSVLTDLYEMEIQHAPGMPHGHTIPAMRVMSYGHDGVRTSLEHLDNRGWAYEIAPGRWALTPEGLETARKFAAAPGGLLE